MPGNQFNCTATHDIIRRMKVSELGEFGLIDAVADLIERRPKQGEAWRNLVIGIGDDCAAWSCQSGLQLATIDALVQDVHFKPGTISWEDLGWKALAVNVSDIAAMGGSPKYALVSLSLPGETEVDSIVSLYSGMLEMAQRHDIAVVGGNMSRSPVVCINIAVMGEEGPSGRIMTRSGAKAGDRIAVTGRLGGASAGLRILTGNAPEEKRDWPALTEAFKRPIPRVSEGLVLAENGVSSGIDLSDGLVSDLGHICKASKLGARIDVDSLPLADGLRELLPDLALELGLVGGEDYELLFTAPAQTIEAIKPLVGCPVTVVGQMTRDTEEQVLVVDRSGREYKRSGSGWDHFVS